MTQITMTPELKKSVSEYLEAIRRHEDFIDEDGNRLNDEVADEIAARAIRALGERQAVGEAMERHWNCLMLSDLTEGETDAPGDDLDF